MIITILHFTCIFTTRIFLQNTSKKTYRYIYFFFSGNPKDFKLKNVYFLPFWTISIICRVFMLVSRLLIIELFYSMLKSISCVTAVRAVKREAERFALRLEIISNCNTNPSGVLAGRGFIKKERKNIGLMKVIRKNMFCLLFLSIWFMFIKGKIKALFQGKKCFSQLLKTKHFVFDCIVETTRRKFSKIGWLATLV